MPNDGPNISVNKKTNEQNIAAIKSYLSELSDALSYLEHRVDRLETTIAAMKESEE